MIETKIITDYIESINDLKSVCPICVKSRRLSRNNAPRDRYTHAQKQCEKSLLRVSGVFNFNHLKEKHSLWDTRY